jgi:YbbR domain-containing protein
MKKKLPIIIASFIFAVIIWISVLLGNSFIYKIQIPLKTFINDNEVAVKSELPATVFLNLKTQGWKLLSILLSKDLAFYCILSAKENSFKYQFANAVAENQWLSPDIKIVDISPVFLQIELDKKISKRVKVNPNVDIIFRKGYGLARQLHVFPDSVTITGAKTLLSRISEISTKDFFVEEVSNQFIEQVGINHSPAIEVDPKLVKVYGDVQKIVDREMQNIPIELKNAPMDKTILLLPDKISVSVTGGINFLGKITEKDFQVFIDYNDIISDTIGSVSPTVIPPQYVRLMYLEPERIKYIIKKY